jgi:hypothetical protein
MVRMDAGDQCIRILASDETDGETEGRSRPARDRLSDVSGIGKRQPSECFAASLDLIDRCDDSDAAAESDHAV